MTTTSFSINWDYRCPFARNANEHVVAALEAGAGLEVEFKAFSLSQVHLEEGAIAVWEDPAHLPDLIALAAGVVVRDRFPEQFKKAHVALFAARHDEGGDLRDEAVVRAALDKGGVDADQVFKEIESGWPLKTIGEEHLASVNEHQAFGVPTFIAKGQAAFVRLMTRPKGDGALAKATIEHVLSLLVDSPEINEFKHTTVSH